jgi:hypothetical protein
MFDANQSRRLAGHAGRKRNRQVARRSLPIGRDGQRSGALALIDKSGVRRQALGGQLGRAQRIKR